MSAILAFSLHNLVPTHRQWMDQMWASGLGLGLALTVGGAAFVFLGYSLSKFFTAISYAFLGWWTSITLCVIYHVESPYVPLICLGVGALLGGIAFPLAKHAVGPLAGIIAGLIVLELFSTGTVYPRALTIVAAIVFVCVVALAAVRHDEVVVFASAAVGGVMLVSGTMALSGQFPLFGKTFRELMIHYPSLLWVSITGPIVIGMAVQLAALKNKGKAVLQ